MAKHEFFIRGADIGPHVSDVVRACLHSVGGHCVTCDSTAHTRAGGAEIEVVVEKEVTVLASTGTMRNGDKPQGSSFRPSSRRKTLWRSLASRIFCSSSTSMACVASRSISGSGSAVLM